LKKNAFLVGRQNISKPRRLSKGNGRGKPIGGKKQTGRMGEKRPFEGHNRKRKAGKKGKAKTPGDRVWTLGTYKTMERKETGNCTCGTVVQVHHGVHRLNSRGGGKKKERGGVRSALSQMKALREALGLVGASGWGTTHSQCKERGGKRNKQMCETPGRRGRRKKRDGTVERNTCVFDTIGWKRGGNDAAHREGECGWEVGRERQKTVKGRGKLHGKSRKKEILTLMREKAKRRIGISWRLVGQKKKAQVKTQYCEGNRMGGGEKGAVSHAREVGVSKGINKANGGKQKRHRETLGARA